MLMLAIDVKIGIWGFGVVGQSLLGYLLKQGYTNIVVYDIKDLSDNCLFATHQVKFTTDLVTLLTTCDYIFPSPGIDLAAYQDYQAKFIFELDLFYENWHKPIIAITGTLGKTTLTTVLANVLNQSGVKAVAAGNVGLAMCDILSTDYELAVLELSSFQLEQCKTFAPDLAIWTNLYPNHLDRHKTFKRYLMAKANIFLQQNSKQIALLPISLFNNLQELGLENLDFKSQLYLFGTEQELLNLDRIIPVYLRNKIQGVFVKQGERVLLIASPFNKSSEINIANLKNFENIDTYEINLVILAAVSYLRQLALPTNLKFSAIAHRVEQFYTSVDGIFFYNDSKSTVAEATLAAVQKLSARPVILFLGGLSKGVDRTSLVQSLSGCVQEVICFGGEADILYHMCQKNNIKSTKFLDLESALDYCLQVAKSGNQILFSPAGSSFDLFANYVQRGETFKKLVLAKCINKEIRDK